MLYILSILTGHLYSNQRRWVRKVECFKQDSNGDVDYHAIPSYKKNVKILAVSRKAFVLCIYGNDTYSTAYREWIASFDFYPNVTNAAAHMIANRRNAIDCYRSCLLSLNWYDSPLAVMVDRLGSMVDAVKNGKCFSSGDNNSATNIIVQGLAVLKILSKDELFDNSLFHLYD